MGNLGWFSQTHHERAPDAVRSRTPAATSPSLMSCLALGAPPAMLTSNPNLKGKLRIISLATEAADTSQHLFMGKVAITMLCVPIRPKVYVLLSVGDAGQGCSYSSSRRARAETYSGSGGHRLVYNGGMRPPTQDYAFDASVVELLEQNSGPFGKH